MKTTENVLKERKSVQLIENSDETFHEESLQQVQSLKFFIKSNRLKFRELKYLY